jgi:7-cyano-7-deazaguanine synthase
VSNSALVLFSGGQDSTTCLAWALSHYEHVETLGFNYGQRHHVELERRPIISSALRQLNPDWDARLGMDHLLDLSVLSEISDTALTSDTKIAMQDNGLPNTFVPGRNLLFLTVAAALAYRRGITSLVGGMCETDYSGYPDCRNDTLRALENALQLGMQSTIRLETPLMWLDKSEAR